MTKIDDIFDKFDRRKETEKKEQDKKDKILKKDWDKGKKILDKIVKPVLQEIVQAINQKGYNAELKTNFGYIVSPRIELLFTPIPKNGNYGDINPSSLELRHDEDDKFIFSKKFDIHDLNDPYSTDKSVKHETVTKEWTKAIALEFIESVLNKN